MNRAYEYVFPAIGGVQAGREYYVSMCPMHLIPRIFLFDEEELLPELRAQRTLNKGRIPEIARYIVEHHTNYVFSAITASIDSAVTFEPLAPRTAENTSRIGLLHIPMQSRFIINDGQHRRAAIELALRERPDLGEESIAVVFFLDIGLERSQQMFADLNRYAIRPSRSLSVLYDHRDDDAKLAKLVVLRSPLFRDVVEMERSTLSKRSRKLFTLSAIYTGTVALLSHTTYATPEDRAVIAADFWEEVAKHFPEWQLVRERKITAGEIRSEYIHSHGIVLQALGKIGNGLLRERKNWKSPLKHLRNIDWSRKNATVWEGRAMIGGRISKAGHNVTLTTNVVKRHLRLPLGPEEQRIEDAFLRGEHAST